MTLALCDNANCKKICALESKINVPETEYAKVRRSAERDGLRSNLANVYASERILDILTLDVRRGTAKHRNMTLITAITH